MRILSVNVARVSRLVVGGQPVASAIGKQPVASAIGKQPVAGAVRVGPLGLEGDEQADPTVHGGLSRAVYAYPAEHHGFWRTVRAQAKVAAWDAPVPPGLLGENLTIEGLTEDRLFVGDQLHLPGCVLAVTAPRFPCAKLGAAMGFAQAVKLMTQSGFCGVYLGVIEPGQLQAGDRIELVEGPREVSVRELFRGRVRG